ncbi:glycoside hydrolase family 3 protein [Pontibacter sp. CAU 1760]
MKPITQYCTNSSSSAWRFLAIALLPFCLAACDTTTSAQQQANLDPGSKVLERGHPYLRPATLVAALQEPESNWVDSVFNTLTPDERIAQLMVVEAFSDKGPAYEADVMRLIKQYKVGGIIFFQGGPVRQAILTNKYQAAAKVPLLISMDAESGVGMRLDSTVQYPFQQMLGAVADHELIYEMGAQIAAEFKRLGMHVNFAPVADINNNPNNPIISYRSFGENREDVTSKSIALMQGMQQNDIIAVAKHFPGHGDTDVDSHHDLPVIPFNRQRLDSLELYPFREMIEYGLGGIMVAHMHIPRLDNTENLPSTLSKPIVTDLLRKQLGFDGLIFTDAMVMKGVTKYFPPGEAEARALMAGNDILERLNSVPRAIRAIKTAIARGDISQAEIDRRCKRILAAKQWVGLDKYKPIELQQLFEDLNTPEADSVNHAIAEAAITLLNNKQKTLPVRPKRRTRIATLSIGARRTTAFQRQVNLHAPATDFIISRKANAKEVKQVWQKLQQYDVVLVGLYGPSIRPSNNLGYSKEAATLVQRLARSEKTIITLFDNAYTLNQFPDIEQSSGLVLAYQPHFHSQEAAAKLIFGKLEARGKLPVTVNKFYAYGHGLRQDASLLATP